MEFVVRAKRLKRSTKLRLRAICRLLEYKNAKAFGRPTVAHHGIERSGTNLLDQVIRSVGGMTANSHLDDLGPRPGHKHLRLQANKATIVSTPKHMHSYTPLTVREYSRASGLPEDTKHIVIFKDPANWIMSIDRYAKKAGWPDGGAVVASSELVEGYLAEWCEYYAAWERLASTDPSLVLMVQYETWMSDFADGLNSIATFVGATRADKVHSVLDLQVNQSGKREIVTLSIDDPQLAERVYALVTWHGFHRFN